MASDLSDHPTNVGGVYAKILKLLWSGEPVPSDELRDHVGQPEWARRTRELRNEFGYPINVFIDRGTTYYQLTGHMPLFATRRRPYFSKADKSVILRRGGPKCAICKLRANGSSMEDVEQTLMWDHRIPFDKLGDTVASNGQLLCRNCNNLKKQACGTCVQEGCDGCLFAYPEKSANIVVIELDDDALARAKSEAAEQVITVLEVISKLIKRHTLPVKVETGSWTFR